MKDAVVLIDSGGANIASLKYALQRLERHNLVDVIRNLTQPVLGICLGMQLLAEASEEDDVECLGIIPGTAARLDTAPGFPVPNMGWCPVRTRAQSDVLDAIEDGSYFYFVHSFALPVNECTIATADHTRTFAAVSGRNNFVATQFHPERSSTAGARLLRNFLGGVV